MGVVSNNWFDCVILSVLHMIQTLMLTDVQTSFLGETPLGSLAGGWGRFSRAREVMIQWAVADYFPVNVSETLEYSVYSLNNTNYITSHDICINILNVYTE